MHLANEPGFDDTRNLQPKRFGIVRPRLLFNLSSILEASTGFALLVAPRFVIELLLGGTLDPVGVAVTRVLGIALVAVGAAGWESPNGGPSHASRVGLCIYNLGAAIVLATAATIAGLHGVLLWPVAGVHALFGIGIVWVLLKPPAD